MKKCFAENVCEILFNLRNLRYILWGDEILADIPSCLGGEDNGTNVA
jgi:hypothetical protein